MPATTDFVPRAMAAWYRARRTDHTHAFPHQARCAQVTLGDGKHYVVLASSDAVVAVYRIKPAGFLRRLKRWPRQVETAAGWHTNESEDMV
jgi:hypothetical protein